MKHTESKTIPELEAEIQLKKTFLRAASLVAGSPTSPAAHTKVAGNEAATLKEEIEALETLLETAKAA